MKKKKWTETEQPHSDAGHNPYWCGGDSAGQCCGDDPCWSCIGWLHAEALDATEKDAK